MPTRFMTKAVRFQSVWVPPPPRAGGPMSTRRTSRSPHRRFVTPHCSSDSDPLDSLTELSKKESSAAPERSFRVSPALFA